MKYKKPSKVTQRAIEGGAIPPACGQVKHYQPKKRFNCRRDDHDWGKNRDCATDFHGRHEEIKLVREIPEELDEKKLKKS